MPLLKSLHWLPVQTHIILKLCTIAYQTLSSRESSYLFFMLFLALKTRGLSSSGFHLLSVPRVKTYAGTGAFSVAIPTLWSSLFKHVKSSNSVVSFHHSESMGAFTIISIVNFNDSHKYSSSHKSSSQHQPSGSLKSK